MDFLGELFKGDTDEILFFILVFLLLFNGNTFDRGLDGGECSDNGSMLFFIILFILLFFSSGFTGDPK